MTYRVGWPLRVRLLFRECATPARRVDLRVMVRPPCPRPLLFSLPLSLRTVVSWF